METNDPAQYRQTERSIAQLTLVLGAVAAAVGCFLFSIRVGAGVLTGSALAWLNFRWLEGALDSLVRVSTAQPGTMEARVPLGSVFLLFARYALITAAVYVTFFVFRVPVLSMLVGLCSLGAATIAASLYEILRHSE
jgi:hypothetical protein